MGRLLCADLLCLESVTYGGYESGGAVIKGKLLSANGDVVSEFVEVSFIAQINGNFPDVEAEAGLPAVFGIFEHLAVVLYAVQLGIAAEEDVADRPAIEAQRAEFEAQHEGDVEILILFAKDGVHKSLLAEVRNAIIHAVGVEEDFRLNEEFLDGNAHKPADEEAVVGIFDAHAELLDAVLVEDVEIRGLDVRTAHAEFDACCKLCLQGSQADQKNGQGKEDALHCFWFSGCRESGFLVLFGGETDLDGHLVSVEPCF